MQGCVQMFKIDNFKLELSRSKSKKYAEIKPKNDKKNYLQPPAEKISTENNFTMSAVFIILKGQSRIKFKFKKM